MNPPKKSDNVDFLIAPFCKIFYNRSILFTTYITRITDISIFNACFDRDRCVNTETSNYKICCLLSVCKKNKTWATPPAKSLQGLNLIFNARRNPKQRMKCGSGILASACVTRTSRVTWHRKPAGTPPGNLFHVCPPTQRAVTHHHLSPTSGTCTLGQRCGP